jgi:hypothetical protein
VVVETAAVQAYPTLLRSIEGEQRPFEGLRRKTRLDIDTDGLACMVILETHNASDEPLSVRAGLLDHSPPTALPSRLLESEVAMLARSPQTSLVVKPGASRRMAFLLYRLDSQSAFLQPTPLPKPLGKQKTPHPDIPEYVRLMGGLARTLRLQVTRPASVLMASQS